MNEPGATIAKLLDRCEKQTSRWPKKGDYTVYARLYLDVDDEQGSDEAYVGQSRDAARRDGEHNRDANIEALNSREGYHANIASRTRPENRHVRILACNKTMGFQHARDFSLDLVEQTAMLALRTYSKMVSDFEGSFMEALAQQSLFMMAIDDDIRKELRFQEDFRPEHRRGINITSPLFGYLRGRTVSHTGESEDGTEEIPSVPMFALHIDPQHPSETGYTQYKMPQVVTRRSIKRSHDNWVLTFNGIRRTAIPGASSLERCRWELDLREDLGLEFHRMFGAKKKVTVMVVWELMDEVQPSEYPGPKLTPFRPPHCCPVFGFPKIGPYRDELGLSSLGMRVEWQDPETKIWYTSRVGKTHRLARHILDELSAGNTSSFDHHFQVLTALIQMLLSQRCLAPAPGFLKEIHPASLTPLIQRLDIDFLKQTARWVTQTTSIVGPVVPTTDEENKERLKAFIKGFQNFGSAPKQPMTVSGHPGSGGDQSGKKCKGKELVNPIFNLDSSSGRSAGIIAYCCDTCQISLRMNAQVTTNLVNMGARGGCDYDDSEKSCTTCKTLRRLCTFTPQTRLLELWAGDDELDEADYRGSSGGVQFPYDGRGPMRDLMVYSALKIFEKAREEFSVIQEPWTSQLSFLMADEAMAENKDVDGGGVAAAEEEEEEEDDE